MSARILRIVLPVFILVMVSGQSANASDPSDIYQAIIDLHHRQLLRKMGESLPEKSVSKRETTSERREKRPLPVFAGKIRPSRRLIAVYGERALLRIGGTDLLVRRGSRVETSGESFRVAEVRPRSVVLIPGNSSVLFLKRTGPAGLFRFRGRTIVRGVSDTIGPWRVIELGMNHALLKNGPDTKRLVPGETPRPRPALILSFSGESSGSLASTDFPKIPFSVREIHGRHALLSFGSEEVEAGIGSTFGRWKIAGIDPTSGVDVLDRLTGNHLFLGGRGGSPGGIAGVTETGAPPGVSPGGVGFTGTPSPIQTFPGSGFSVQPPGPIGPSGISPGGFGIQRGMTPGAPSQFYGGGGGGNSGPFAQPPGGPQLPYNGF